MKKKLLLVLFLLSALLYNTGFAQTLIVSSPSYCTGGTGVTFGITSSNTGTTYFLEKQTGATWSNADTTLGSTGVTVYFPKLFLAGTYRLKNTATTIAITATVLPENLYNVTVSALSGGKLTPAGAGYCSGAFSYPTIGLSGSQPVTSGIKYKLYRNGIVCDSMFGGTGGAAISFGQRTEGTYTIKAFRNGCSRDMTGSKVISVFPLPNVSFTPTYLGAPNQCGTVVFDTNIFYTPAYSGAPYSFTWTFPPSSNPISSTLATPTCQFPAYGTGTQSFSLLLQVTDKNGCSGSSFDYVFVQQRPDATVEPSNLIWNNCNSDPTATFPITIVNKSVTASSNTSYTIDWDDSSPLETYTSAQFPYDGQKSHIYTSKGTFHLTITASGPAVPGCVDTKTFPVFNGSTPTGGLTYDPGILEGCKPHTITFFLSGNAQNNAPTTKYYFDFGDGSAPLIFFQENMPPLNVDGKYHITHTYNDVSCSAPGQAFTLQHYIENRCSRIDNNISGIKISKKSASEFLRTEFPADPIYVCAGISRVYTNESSPGCIIYGGSTLSATDYYWDFDNNGSYEITGGSPSYTFPTPGLYPVTLKSITGQSLPFNCGDSVSMRMVCVQAPPEAGFSNVPAAICVNSTIEPVNNSISLPDCANPIYQWTITPSIGWNFSDGNSSSFEPTFNFTTPGVYTITLEVIVNSGNSVCNTDTYDQIITIKSPPTITVNQPPSMMQCGPGSIDLSTVVSYNSNNSAISNYLWTITPLGATISDPNLQYPIITIVDDATRVYTLTVSTTNECGLTVSTPITITVTQTITNNTISYAGGTDLCNGMTLTSDIIGNVPSGGDNTFTYHWYIYNGSSWTPGATTQSLHFTTPLTANPTKFKRKAISGSCVLESDSIIFTVFSGIQNNVISQNQSLCSGSNASTISGTIPTQGNGIYTYLWEQSTASPDVWGPAIALAPATNTAIDFSPGSLTQTTRYRRIVYSGVCDLQSNTIEKTVYPIPAINSASTATICSGVALNYQITSSAPGSSYSWIFTDFSGGSITGASNYPSGTSAIITDVLTNNSNVPKTIQYAITPTGPPTTSCLGNVFYLTVTVRPKFNSTYSGQSISNGTTTTITGSMSGGTPGYNYSWAPVDKLATGQSTLPNPQTTVLSASQNYTLTVTDAASCQFTQVITISTTGASLNATISSNDADQTICEGNTITLTASATGGGGGSVPGNYSYSWSGLPGGATYLQPWIVQFVPANFGSNTYSVSVQDGFTSFNTSISITVNKIPSVTSDLTSQICSGEDLAYLPQSDVPGTSFNWVRGTNTCIASAPAGTTGTGTINNVLTNSCTTIENITYTITPTGPAPTFCIGTPVTLTVSVDPVASITNTVNSQTVVAGYSSAEVTFTSNVASAGIHWKYSSMSTACAGLISFTQIQGYTSTLPSQTISLLTGAPATCTLSYEVKPYMIITIGDTCWGNPFIYTFNINSEPTKYNMICPLPVCTGQTATISLSSSDLGIDYRLYRGLTNILPMKPGTGAQLDWPGISTAGSYTIKATNTTNGQTTLMNGMCQVVLNPLPSIFILTELNGEHCVPLTLQLSGSQLNVNYELYNNGNPTGIVIPGTNTPGFLAFPAVNDSGTYTVYAQNSLTGCGRFMLGSIHADPIPQEFEISPGGILCEGITLCIEHSEPGVNYQLWLDNEPFGDVIPGDPQGDSICFTPCISPGVYRIHAIYPNTGCNIFFTQAVTVNPLPIQYIIAPDFGCAGAEISLNGCQAGINYFLFFEPSGGKSMMELLISGPINCSSSGTLSFGTFPDAGVYRVKAVNPATGCWSWMTGTTTLYPNPIVYEISPQQGGCPPIEIYLENFQSNAVYYLYKNNNLVGTDTGLDGQVNFGEQTEKGIYTVKAQISYPNGVECWSDMNGSIEVIDSPIVYTLLPVGPLCAPVNLFLNGSQIGTTYTLWNSIQGIVQTLPGNGGFLYFAKQPYEGDYWVKAANNTTACDSTMINRVTVNKRPHVYDLLPNGPVCGTSSICLSGSEANTTYELLDENEASLSPPVFNPPTSPSAGFCFAGVLTAGIYKLKATNTITGCDTIYADSVVIHHLPFVFAGADDTICNVLPSVVLLHGDTAYCKNVQWSSSTGGVFSNPTNPTTTYTFSLLDIINKSVTLTLSAEGVGACFGTFASDEITIQILAPTVNASADTVIGVCTNYLIPATVSEPAAYTCLWSCPANPLNAGYLSDVTLQQPTFSGAPTGTYIFRLTVTNANGCYAYDEVKIVVDAAPTTNAGLDKSLGECITPAQSVVLNGSGTGTGIVYSWSPVTHLAGANTATPTFSGASAGTYTYTLTVTDAFNCTATDVVVV
ncbi:MAG: PKD-like domain-containing protein, partial [Bacteroidales bacterium]